MCPTIQNLAVSITGMVDEQQPGWVACIFSDAAGKEHKIVDKVPIFYEGLLDASSQYPIDGYLRCEVLAAWHDSEGRELKRISTVRPDDVESTEKLSEFVVLSKQISS
jgi:hypothetical protein